MNKTDYKTISSLIYFMQVNIIASDSFDLLLSTKLMFKMYL